GVWALHAMERFEMMKQALPDLSKDDSPYVRGWAHQIRFEKSSSEGAQRFGFQFSNDQMKTAIERKFIVSAILRVPEYGRVETLKNITQYAEDANDHVLPYLYWYALEP